MTTLSQLKADIDEWLARDDIAVSGGSIASIIRLGEAEIARDIHTLKQEKRAPISFTSNYADLPADFLHLRDINIPNCLVEYAAPEVIRESVLWTRGGGSEYLYSIESDDDLSSAGLARLVLAPGGSATTPVVAEINYKARFPALVADGDSNWLLVNHYDVYLWQMLKQAAIFIDETEKEAKYDNMYQRAKESVGKNENRKRFRGNQKQQYGNPRTVV